MYLIAAWREGASKGEGGGGQDGTLHEIIFTESLGLSMG